MSATDVHVTVEEITSSPVETIGADCPVSEAARLLYENRIGSLLVADADETVGIVAETDVVGLVPRDDPHTTPVGEIGPEALITVERDAGIEAAAERTARHTVKELPVTDEGAIVGVVTTTDVSNYSSV